MTSLYSEDNFSITHQGVQNSASSSLCHVLDVSHASRFLPALGLNTRSPFWDSFFLTPSLACLPDSICFSYNKCYLCCLLAVGFPLSFAPVICCCITNHPLLGGVNNSFFFFFNFKMLTHSLINNLGRAYSRFYLWVMVSGASAGKTGTPEWLGARVAWLCLYSSVWIPPQCSITS